MNKVIKKSISHSNQIFASWQILRSPRPAARGAVQNNFLNCQEINKEPLAVFNEL